jgi:hypothetical protein
MSPLLCQGSREQGLKGRFKGEVLVAMDQVGRAMAIPEEEAVDPIFQKLQKSISAAQIDRKGSAALHLFRPKGVRPLRALAGVPNNKTNR